MRARDAWLRAVKGYLASRDKESTAGNYARTLRTYLYWFEEHDPRGAPNPATVKKERLEPLLIEEKGRGLAPTTVRQYFAPLVGLLKFVGNYRVAEYVHRWKPKVKYVWKRKSVALSRIQRLFHGLENSPEYSGGPEHDQEIQVLGTGTRIGDAVQLTRSCFDRSDNILNVPRPTKDGPVTRYIHPWTEDRLWQHRYFLTRDPDEPLLLWERRGAIRMANRVLRDLGLDEEFGHWTNHRARHTLHQVLLDAGLDRETIALFEGRTPPIGSASYYGRPSPSTVIRNVRENPRALALYSWGQDADEYLEGPSGHQDTFVLFQGLLPQRPPIREKAAAESGYINPAGNDY